MIGSFRKMVHLRHHEIEHMNGSTKGCRPLRGLDLFFDLYPGANASGSMPVARSAGWSVNYMIAVSMAFELETVETVNEVPAP